MDQSLRKIYLIPSLLASGTKDEVLPPAVLRILNETEFYFAEEIRSARRFLSEVGIARKIEELSFFPLHKDTTRDQLLRDLKEIPADKNIGMISEAGCPCIADPGALLAGLAHEKGWEVVPLVGPSSILLALIGSGFNGQNFAFHGYLPIEKDKREKAIRELEKESLQKGRTQIFMETPYRNNKLIEDLLKVCLPETRLCLAADLTSPAQTLRTKRIKDWKKSVPDLNKRPCVFVLSAV